MPLLRLERPSEWSTDTAPSEPSALVAVKKPGVTHHADTADERLAAFGLRSLADLLAPSSLVVADDQLLIEGEYTRVLAVADLPPVVAAGWLNGVLAEHLAIDLSMHVRPLDGGAAASALKLKSWRLGGALNDDAANGRLIDNHLTTALEQIERLRRGLARREIALFSVGLYLRLRASSRAELDELTQQVAGLLAAQAAAALVPRLQQEQGSERACRKHAMHCRSCTRWILARCRRSIHSSRLLRDYTAAFCSESTSRSTTWSSWTCSTTACFRTPTLASSLLPGVARHSSAKSWRRCVARDKRLRQRECCLR